MNIALKNCYQQSRAAGLFLLFAFSFMCASQANAVITAEGEWQNAGDLSVSQGSRFYDRSQRLYYTYNTVASSAGDNLSGELRLVVESSSHTVLNADGTTDGGKPYFGVPAGGAEHTVRINFQRKRAAFSYTTQMQRYVEASDADADGVIDADDQCPNTPAGETVDAAGCSDSQKDDDNDGVFNSADECPETPTGETVDAAGCSDSQKDDDEDGVVNSDDECPNTPAGEMVDAAGCGDSQKDDDEDGIVNSEDYCPADAGNSCFTINVTVRAGGTALPGAEVIVGIDGGVTSSGPTNGDGELTVPAGHPDAIGNDGLDDFFPVSAAVGGFATGFAKVVIVPEVFEYDVEINLAPVSDLIGEDEDLDAGVSIEKSDETVGFLRIPTSALPGGVTQITGQITYLDPATDVSLAPGGDLLALPEGSNPNDTPVPLETFGMMEFDLVDQNGNPVHQLDTPAEVCMQAGPGLATGDTIPLWYYDDELGLWIEEGQGTVETREGKLMICGDVDHFSWWNYDQPINTHSCFKYHFVDADSGNSLRDAFNWYAEGKTYNGTSPERLCDLDGNDPVAPAPNDDSIDSLTVKRTTVALSPEQIRVTTTIGGNKYYLVRNPLDGTYGLSANINEAEIFDNPTANASCLNNTNVADCLFLDYKEGVGSDGILELRSDINLPPIISGLGSEVGLWGSINVGAELDVSAMVTDPEGSTVDGTWSAQCYGSGDGNGEMNPAGYVGAPSGASVGTTFTAPGSVNYFYSYCELTVTATDAAGNTSAASYWVNIVDPDFVFVLSGILYGPDGLPMPNHLMVSNGDDGCGITDVTTDADGYYNIAMDAACGEEGFYGDIEVPFSYGGVNWVHNEDFDLYSCGDEYEGELGPDAGSCERDIHLPTVWASVTGALDPSVSPSTIGLEIFQMFFLFGGNAELNGEINVPANAESYGPVMLPVSGDSWLSHSATGFGRGFQLPSVEPAVLDLKGSATGSALITVFDAAGDPLPGQSVTVYDNDSNSVIGVTDSNGEFLAANLPLGPVWSENGRGFIDRANQQVVIDVNSPDVCSIEGSTYNQFGTAEGPVDLGYNSWSNGQSLAGSSDAGGAFTIPGVLAGSGYLYGNSYSGGYYRYGETFFTIDNCRGSRVFRVDVPMQSEYFYYYPE